MPKRTPGRLATIGYRGKDRIEGFDRINDTLDSADLYGSLLVDVRHSRGPRSGPYSAAKVRKTCEQGGDTYLWMPELGNPSHTLPWVSPHVDKARWAIEFLASQVADGVAVVLLCACYRHNECHRTEVADRIAEAVKRLTGQTIVPEHLGEGEG